MASESFRERNRLRRERNASANLAAYAEAAQIPNAGTAAAAAAAQIHGEEASAGREDRLREWLHAAAENRLHQRVAAPAPVSAPAPAAPAARAARAPKASKPAARAAARPAAKKETADAAAVPHRLEDRTKEQLYARAQELEIEGRSQMTKDELIAAIRAAG